MILVVLEFLPTIYMLVDISWLHVILALLGVASASGYQMVVNVGEAKQIKDAAITSLQVSFRIIFDLPFNT